MNSKIFSFLLSFVWIAPVLAASHGGLDAGGGDGVLIGGKPYLLDLVEAGVHENPYFEPEGASQQIRSIIQRTLSLPASQKKEILPLLTLKLSELDRHASPGGLVLAEAFRFYRLTLTDFSLIDIPDDDSVLGADKIQLAVRKGGVIYLNKNYWDLLDLPNKVALLLHEIIYAFQPAHSNGWPDVLKGSSKARVLTGMFFRENWSIDWLDAMEREFSYSAGSLNYLFTILSRFGTHKGVKVSAMRSTSGVASSFRFSHFLVRSIKNPKSVERLNVGSVKKNSSEADMRALCRRALPSRGGYSYKMRSRMLQAPAVEMVDGRLILNADDAEDPKLNRENDFTFPEIFFDFFDKFSDDYETDQEGCFVQMKEMRDEFLD